MNSINNNLDSCKCAGIDLVMYSAIVSIILSRDLNIVQIDLLSSFLQSIGQNLSVISSAKSKCEEAITNNTTTLSTNT